MRLFPAVLAALAVLGAGPSFLPAQEKVDYNQPQSPAKPAPKWLKIIDQGTVNPQLKGYKTPEGIKVEVVADYPAVVNPVGMTFGDDGTPYVLEWRPDTGPHFKEHAETFTYKDGSKRNVATMKKRVLDAVKVLRDTKGKGVYDEAKVILEDELPSSILLHDGWLYLSGRGTVRRYRLADLARPQAAKAEVIAQGFCGYHHHQVSGLTIGNDGWLYITAGDDDNYVEGSDGSRATVLRTGAVFRCRPDGSKMHEHARGFRNPYRDVAFDTAYNMFHADNDNEDGSKFTGCRLMHIAEGSDFGWRLRLGARCCQPDFARGAVYGELPGKLPPMLKTGRGAPAGLLIYNDTRFPEPYRGLLLYPDVFRKLIRAYKVQPKGATFEVAEEFEFLSAQDDLFRPCQMVLGPDGAIYVVDWRTNSGGAGQLWGDGQHGRIYRITWAGTKEQPALPPRGLDSWLKVVRSSDDDLVKALSAPDFSDREKAQQELRRRGPRNTAALLKIMGDRRLDPEPRIAALGVVQSFWSAEVEALFLKLLEDPEDDLRRLAADALALNARPGDKEVHAALLQALDDPNLSVRRSLFLAMGQVNADGAADALVNSLSFDAGKDVYLRDGLVRAIEKTGKLGVERLLALAESGVQTDIDKVVEAFTALRTRPGADAVPTLLKNPHLTAAQRAALLKSYGNYLLDPPISVEPALAYLLAHPDEPLAVKMGGLEALAGGGALKGDKAQAWVLKLLDEADAPARLVVIKALEDGRVAAAAPRLGVIVGDASRPTAERAAAGKALRVLNDKGAVAALKQIVAKDVATPDLALLRLEAFRTLAVLDPGAARQSAKDLLGVKDRALLTEAINVVGQQPAGAKEVAQLFLANKLPRDLLPQVSEGLRRHAAKDEEAGKLLTQVLKSGLLLSTDKAEVERVRQLVAAKGNADRGKALYLNSKALQCINCHRLEGVGGNVGPDLTRVWDTSSVEKIMEAIIEPSKEIKEGYTTYVATTKKGLTVTGLKVAQTADEVIIRDANGKDVRIAAKDLDELTASKVSLMPEGLVANLSYDQFIDLVAFLKSQRAQESLRGLVLEYSVVGPFGPDLKAAYPPEAKPDPAATYPGAKPGEVLAWQPASAEPSGLLNLRPLFNRNDVSAYALAYVFSPKAQAAEMRLGTGDTARVWLNGAVVHEQTTSRAAAPEQDRVSVTLKQGWNPVLVKLTSVRAEQGLYLRFAGDGLRTARKPQD